MNETQNWDRYKDTESTKEHVTINIPVLAKLSPLLPSVERLGKVYRTRNEIADTSQYMLLMGPLAMAYAARRNKLMFSSYNKINWKLLYPLN